MSPRLGKALAALALTGGLVAAAHGQSGTGPLAVEDRSVERNQGGNRGSEDSDANRDEAVMMLMDELEQYRDETRNLRNQVEQLQHRLDQMRKAQRERYLDLDTRLNALAEASTRQEPESQSSDEEDGPEDPEADRQAYQAAKDALLQRNFKAAEEAFEEYLDEFSDGQFRPDARFWLGEVYRNMPDRDADAREQFRVVVDEYPEHSKTPAAMYKLATLQADAGELGKARVMLEKLRMQFPDSREAELAARLLDELDGGDQERG